MVNSASPSSSSSSSSWTRNLLTCCRKPPRSPVLLNITSIRTKSPSKQINAGVFVINLEIPAMLPIGACFPFIFPNELLALILFMVMMMRGSSSSSNRQLQMFFLSSDLSLLQHCCCSSLTTSSLAPKPKLWDNNAAAAACGCAKQKAFSLEFRRLQKGFFFDAYLLLQQAVELLAKKDKTFDFVTTTTTMLIPGRIGGGNERLLLQSMRLCFLKKSCWRSSLHYTHCIKEKTLRCAHRHTDTDIQTNGNRGSLCRVSRSSQLSSHITSSSSGNQNPTKDKNSTQSVSQSVTNRFHKQAAAATAATAAPSLYGFLHHLLLPGSFSLFLCPSLFSSLSNCVLYKQTLKAPFSQQ